METALSVCLGLGLSAACGFRVFVPLLVMSVATRAGYLTLSSQFEWVGGTPALITFAVATALEVAAYYLPWVDNFLDTVATPAAVIAGTIVTASVVVGIDPYLKWTLAVIAGGGLAGSVQFLTTGARQISSLVTAGFGNPAVSTMELGGSVGLSLLAIFVPILAVIVVVSFVVYAARYFRRRRAPV